MKRILAFVMLLVVLAVCSGCGGDKIDPVLVPMGEVLLDEWYPYGLVDSDLAIAEKDLGKSKCIISLNEDKVTPLVNSDLMTAKEMGAWRASLFNLSIARGSEFTLLYGRQCGIVADKNTGTSSVIFFEDTESVLHGISADNQIFGFVPRTNKVVLFDVDGNVTAEKQFSEYDGTLCAVQPLADGLLLLFRGDRVHWEGDENSLLAAYQYMLVTTDLDMNVRASKVIGTFDYHNGDLDTGFQVPGSDNLLLSLGGNILLYDMGNEKSKVLVIDDDNHQFVAYENTEDMLKRILGYSSYLAGVSADGKYALYVSAYERGLYMIDLKSMEVTQQMDKQELKDIGIDSVIMDWPGGEYLTDNNGQLFRLVDRSTLPAE